jgi:hypothetical protein
MENGYIPLLTIALETDILETAEQMFSDIIWADSMAYEDFTIASGLSFNVPKYFAIRPGIGLEVKEITDSEDPALSGISQLIINSSSFEDLSPTDSELLETESFPGNEISTAPSVSGTYTGTYPKDYKVMIETGSAGDYTLATYSVYEVPFLSTPITSGLSVDEWENIIPLASGIGDVQIKWEENPGDFEPGDAWMIGARTGNIHNFIVETNLTGDGADNVTVDISLDGGSNYLEDITLSNQYSEEDPNYGWAHTGNDLKWRINIPGEDQVFIKYFFVFTGDFDAVTYWES